MAWRADAGRSGTVSLEGMRPLPRPRSPLRLAALLGLGIAAVPVPLPAGPVVPGGWTPQDPGTPQVRAAAVFAAHSLSQELARDLVVEQITEAESEAVAGTDYRIAFRLAQLQDDVLGSRDDCTVVVYRPAAPQAAEQLTSFDCQNLAAPAAATVHV